MRSECVFVIVACLVLCGGGPAWVEAHECENLDIRNSVADLEVLRNCTVVHGFLQLVLLDSDYNNFTGVSFPELREVTGFLLVFRVYGLTDLGQLFPNLVVIRGAHVFANYALIVYGCPDLRQIGLRNLLLIERGFVRIELCDNLCFTNTINWDLITVQQHGANFLPTDNPRLCPPAAEACTFCPMPYCWSRENCQKSLSNDSFTETSDTLPELIGQCHSECLGRCSNKTAAGCFVCKNVNDKGLCAQNCTAPRILNTFTNRCVTEEQCRFSRMVVVNNECTDVCPVGFMKVKYRCIRCKEKCPKVCPGAQVDYVSSAEGLRGCTHINGSLLIKMNSDVWSIMNDLERTMGDIEEIDGYLKIYKSATITSLDFLKSLKVIRGNRISQHEYPLMLYENANLKKLMDFTNRDKLEIHGGMSFHKNFKLCKSEIVLFKRNTIYNESADDPTSFSNGWTEYCDFVLIKSDYELESSHCVTLYWEPFHSQLYANTSGVVRGYTIYYIETKAEDMTWFTGWETCSKYSWRTITLDNVGTIDFDRDRMMYKYDLGNLKQITKYAFYIRSFQSTPNSLVNGQTTVKLFTTLLHRLSAPIVSTFIKGETTITLQWKVREKERNAINFFYLDVLRLPDEKRILDQRDYCQHPPEVQTEAEKNATQLLMDEEALAECNCDDDIENEDYVLLQQHRYDQFYELFYGDSTISCLEQASHSYCETFESSRFKRHLESFHATRPEGEEQNIEKRSVHKSDNYVTSFLIEKDVYNFTVTKLLPYTKYAFQVFACNTKNDCSTYFMHFERTNPNITNDVVKDEDITADEAEHSEIVVHFPEPVQPNGMTLAFQIQRRLMSDESAFRPITCVTRLEHQRSGYSFRVKHLPRNCYGFRVRPITLASEGVWSDWKVRDTRSFLQGDDPVITVVFGTLGSVVGFFLLIFSYASFKCSRGDEESIYLLEQEELEMIERHKDRDPRLDDPDLDLMATTSFIEDPSPELLREMEEERQAELLFDDPQPSTSRDPLLPYH